MLCFARARRYRSSAMTVFGSSGIIRSLAPLPIIRATPISRSRSFTNGSSTEIRRLATSDLLAPDVIKIRNIAISRLSKNPVPAHDLSSLFNSSSGTIRTCFSGTFGDFRFLNGSSDWSISPSATAHLINDWSERYRLAAVAGA